MTDASTVRLPAWARVLDAIGFALILLGLSVMLTGGFREWTPLGRVSMTSWARPVLIGAVVLFVRHLLRRSPSLPRRMWTAWREWRASPEARLIGPIFISTRVGVLLIGFLGIVLIGYAPNTPPWRVYPNDFLNLPARWDAGWYLGVAVEGYEWSPSRPTAQQNIAFFPAFPMLMRYGALFAARQTMWVGVAIAFVSFFFALRYLFWLARATLDDDRAIAAVALLATYPFAFFFSAPYTESIFLLAMVGAFYHFERSELWPAAGWGLLAGLTRPNGCLLSVALGLMAIRPLWQGRVVWRALADRLAVAAMPGIGMLIYSTYIYSLTGHPFQWATQNAAWGRVYRGIDRLVGDRVQFVQQYGFYDYATTRGIDMLQAAALLFVLATVWPVFRRFGLPYAALILVNIAPPLFMGGLLSMGRLTSVLFPTFLWLGAAIPAHHRFGWLIGFAMLQALGAITFFTWRPLY
jgi:hypothetical protein